MDYEDLYLYYIVGRNGDSLCKALLRSFLPFSTIEDREALAHDVWLRCREQNMLARWDTSKRNFGGCIFVVARTIAVNFLSQRGRNPISGLSAGSLVSTAEDQFEPGSYSLDTLFVVLPPDRESQLDAKEKVARLFTEARKRFRAPKNKRDRNLLPMLNLMLEGRDSQECGELLGVTTSTVYNWQVFVRSFLNEE